MIADWFLAALRRDRAIVLGGLALTAAVAWAYLFLGAGIGMEEMDMGGGQMMMMMPEWSPAYGLIVFVMWTVMMMAMMLPSVAPVTLLVAGIARRQAASETPAPVHAGLFVLGYLAVWFGFSAAATLLQWGLDQAAVLSDTMSFASTMVAGAVLVVAGVYQWTPLKQACLRHCRSPFEFLMLHWRNGALGAFTSGLRHGAFCLGCCWMLMALLFVGGIMNLAWIAAIALIVLIEKALPWGGRMSWVTGAALVGWGAETLFSVI